MSKNGPEFYDVEAVYKIYSEHRSDKNSPNETMEQPVLWELIGNPLGQDILDIGCGDARVARKFRQLGARAYIGVEASKRMVEAAQMNLELGFSQIQTKTIENAEFSDDEFDLVVSSLALHYVENLSELFKNISMWLRTGGRFIFSVEHPVITSCNRSLENSAVRQAWIVDDYFKRGRRNVQWMGDTVIKFHRPLEDFIRCLSEANFSIHSLKEADPTILDFADSDLRERRSRIPLFLIIEARKN